MTASARRSISSEDSASCGSTPLRVTTKLAVPRSVSSSFCVGIFALPPTSGTGPRPEPGGRPGLRGGVGGGAGGAATGAGPSR